MSYEHVIKNVSTGEITVVPFTEAEIAALNAANRRAELAAALETYLTSIEALKVSWTSAGFTGGTTRDAKLAAIEAERVELKATYAAEVAAIKAKYL